MEINTLQHHAIPEVLDVSTIQRILSCGKNQAYALVNSGQFHSVKVGKRILVDRDVFYNWLKGRTI